MILDCKQMLKTKKEYLKQVLEKGHCVQPSLKIIQLGTLKPADSLYSRLIQKDCKECGIDVSLEHLLDPSLNDLHDIFRNLGIDKHVDGILVQTSDVKFKPYELYNINGKNVECIDYRPCVVVGILTALNIMMDNSLYNLDGKDVVIINRSNIGYSLFENLRKYHATVSICNSHTKDLKYYTSNADVIITAAGVKDLITADMIKDGVSIVDAGTVEIDGKCYGDCAFDEIKDKVANITPVPNGIGQLTRGELLRRICYLAHPLYKKELEVNY